MPVPKSNQRAVNKYCKNNYDNVQIRVPKGMRDSIKRHAEKQGESLNAFAKRAIQETMAREGTCIELATEAEMAEEQTE